MKKIYSILMASAVALSASAISIETADFGPVQDFRLPEGFAPQRTLSVDAPVKTAPSKIAKFDLPAGKYLNPALMSNPKSRVLGGFEGDVTKYNMCVYVDYFEKAQLCSSSYSFEVIKEATADDDAEIALTGILPASVQGVKSITGTMSPTGEIKLPFGQTLFTQKGGTTTRKYVFEAATTQDEQEGALFFTYDSNNNMFTNDSFIAVGVYDNDEFQGYYCVMMSAFFTPANGSFMFAAQKQGGKPQTLGMDILAIVQHDSDSDTDFCFIGGLSLWGDSMLPLFNVVDGDLVALRSTVFTSPDFSEEEGQEPVYYNNFMLASYDPTNKNSVFPVVAAYDPDMGVDSDTNEKIFDVYAIPNFQFVDPYLNLSIFDYMRYATGDGYIFVEKGTVSGVEDVVAAPSKANARYYNVQGMEVKNPAKGQFLIEKSGDDARKIIF